MRRAVTMPPAPRRGQPGPRSRTGLPGPRPVTAARIARRTTLALRVFGSAVVNRTTLGRNDRPRCAATRSASSARSASSGVTPARGDDQRPQRLALHLVGHPDRRRLHHRRVGHQGRLHLGRAEPLAGHLDGVVAATVQVPAAVLDRRPVTVHPHVGPTVPVRLEVALGRLPQSPGHAGPRTGAHQLADLLPHGLALLVVDVDRHAERRTAEGHRREVLHGVG